MGEATSSRSGASSTSCWPGSGPSVPRTRRPSSTRSSTSRRRRSTSPPSPSSAHACTRSWRPARRARRAARQAHERRRRTPAPQADAYPELEATFQPPTRSQPGTALQPTIVAEPAVVSGTRKVLLGGVAPARPAAGRAVPPPRGGRPAPAEVRIAVRSQPMGAAVLVDGRDTGVTTNGEIVLPAPAPAEVTLTFRKPGHREEPRT